MPAAAPPPQQLNQNQNGYHYTALTRANLAQLPQPPRSNRQVYLSTDQNFERIPLALETHRVDKRVTLRDWEDRWVVAGRAWASGWYMCIYRGLELFDNGNDRDFASNVFQYAHPLLECPFSFVLLETLSTPSSFE
ncbi:hypothetical protein BDZ45DRAFT_734397 [Acephala macrosclerotiorum]|nr:hypothetical protein BDZ45DRAFT_734397 [Acephala macrosclerotiorum]